MTYFLWFLMNASIIADWGQTRYIARHPDMYYEKVNHLLGPHPSVNKVDAMFLSSLVINNGIMIVLPKKYKPYYAGVVSAVEVGMVVNNNSIGIKIDF